MPVDGGGQVQRVVPEFIDDVDDEIAVLLSPDYWGRKNTIGEDGLAKEPVRSNLPIDDIKVADDRTERGRNACREKSKEANNGAKLRHREGEYQRRRESKRSRSNAHLECGILYNRLY